jgi:putative membrane protein
MDSPLLQLIGRWVVLALGVAIATRIVPGIECNDGVTLLIVVLFLGLFNAVLKPLLVLFTLPFILLTLGLGVLVINAMLFLLVGEVVKGFHVESFWSALGGALVVSVTNVLLSGFTRRARPSGSREDPAQPRPSPPGPARGERPAKRKKDDDVIDI